MSGLSGLPVLKHVRHQRPRETDGEHALMGQDVLETHLKLNCAMLALLAVRLTTFENYDT